MQLFNMNAITLLERISRALIKENRYKLYLEGLGNTLIIALLACLIGILIGIFVALVIYSNKKHGSFKILSPILKIYVTVVRGTPVVLQLFIMYFVILVSFDSGVLIGAITFGINSGAYVAEIVRAGYESIDDGQMEAGRSLGLSNSQTMLRITTPQAVRNVLPPLFNEFISLVKETAIVGYVGIVDLGKVPGIIQSRTFDYIIPLLIAAVVYLAIVMLLTLLLRAMEKRLSKSDRNRGVKQK
jgi:His/Glu/Gln/Arg/opine family amino acid ABC transporter permease subunit